MSSRRGITFDRFNLGTFMGEGWSIWRGPANGNGLNGDEEQDERSLALDFLDPRKILLDSRLKSGERFISNEERLSRLKDVGHIRLDIRIFQSLWQEKNQVYIPASWKELTDGVYTTYITFDGTVLRSPNGRRCVEALYWHADTWCKNIVFLADDCRANVRSAVLLRSHFGLSLV